jgi:thiamine kinase-like enzyme
VLRKIKKGNKPFIFDNEDEELKQLARVERAIEENNDRQYTKISSLKKWRYRLQLQYPSVFIAMANFYRRFKALQIVRF